MKPAAPTTRRAPDVARLLCGAAWLMLAVLAPWHAVADSRSDAVAAVLIAWGWLGWTAVATALLVGAPVSLSVVRQASPLAVAVSVVDGSPLSIAVAVIAVGASFAPSFGDQMVQGGAYGRERRFTLRTPVPQMAPAFIAWVICTGSLIGGSLFTAARAPIVGVPLLGLAAVLGARTPKHLHRLSRRWLVVVPAGIVVHDHVVLAETVMVRTSHIASLTSTDEAGEAADLTGGVTGRRLLVSMTEADKVVLSPITAKSLGTTEALHVLSFTVAPRRPDAVISALAR